jgi:hypothetical protein
MNKYNLILKTINITKTILIFLIAMLPIVYFSSGLVISVMTDNLDNEKHKGSLFVYNMVQIFLIPIIYTCILLQYSENYPQKLSNYDTIVSSKHDVVIKKPFSFYLWFPIIILMTINIGTGIIITYLHEIYYFKNKEHNKYPAAFFATMSIIFSIFIIIYQCYVMLDYLYFLKKINRPILRTQVNRCIEYNSIKQTSPIISYQNNIIQNNNVNNLI